jgi:type I restriction enzyme S subunit
MNAEHLLQHFDRVSEAPDAIPRLRQFILDLAVRGKLVEQDSNDEPATALLCELREAKDRLQEEENLRGRQPVPRTESSALSFTVPDSWEFPAFDDVFVIVSGVTKGRNLAGRKTVEVPYLRVANVQRGYLDLSVMKTIYIPEDELPRYALRHEDILMTEGGDWDKLGRAAIWLGEIEQCIHQNHVFRVRSPLPAKLCPKWVVTYTNSLLGRSYFENAAKQTTNLASINMTQLRGCPLPLPPLAEQHRIVTKVDELMALCDQLEAAQTEREQSRDRLVAASLHRLNSPADTAETDAPDLSSRQADAFRNHARFVFDHLPLLTTRPEHIKQLRQTILNLAVRGKLVPQDPNDELAEELLKRLTQSKQQNGMQSRKGAQLQQLNDENGEMPFQIPSSWLWLRIGTLFEVAGGIQKTPLRTPKSNAFPYLGVGNVYRGRIDLTTVKEFELQDGDLERWRLEAGDLLIIEGNGSLSEIGRCAVWNGEIESCVHQNHVIRCRPLDLQISPFVLQFLNSPAGMAIMQRLAITSSGLYSLSVGKIRQIEVPLPPLAEQHRIVARVDELMAVCDQLEAQLTATEADSRRLLEAMLHEALNPLPEVTEQGGRLQAG